MYESLHVAVKKYINYSFFNIFTGISHCMQAKLQSARVPNATPLSLLNIITVNGSNDASGRYLH